MLTIFKTTLTEKKHLVNNVYLFTFKLLNPGEISFEAGQYLMLKVPKNGSFVSRLYSIASAPSVKDSFEFIVEIIPGGLASTMLDGLVVGQEVEFQGPAGLFTIKDKVRKKIFLITGTGIAPVRAMLKSGIDNFELFWGVKTLKDLYLFDEMKQFNPKICLSRETDLSMIPEEDRKYFCLGHVNDCFEKMSGLESSRDAEFFLCGGRLTVESLRLYLLGKNVPPENIRFEKF